MSSHHGRFVWYELMTTDTGSAQAFYGKVVGWGAHDSGVPGVPYTIFTSGGSDTAGLMTLPVEAQQGGTPPGWIGYVAVDDVDATAERVKGAGGTLHVGPRDIPTVGRFAVVSDPQGAVLALFKGSGAGMDQLPNQMDPGRIGWHELCTTSFEQALTGFYGPLFGWQKGEPVDMGEMGTYQMYRSGEATLGGMFNKMPGMPACFWLYYFNVEAIDAAKARVAEAGGQVVNGPMEVPGGSWILHARDPQGAMFALVAPKR